MLAMIFLSWFTVSLLIALFLGVVLGNITEETNEAAYAVATSKIIPFSKIIDLQNVS